MHLSRLAALGRLARSLSGRGQFIHASPALGTLVQCSYTASIHAVSETTILNTRDYSPLRCPPLHFSGLGRRPFSTTPNAQGQTSENVIRNAQYAENLQTQQSTQSANGSSQARETSNAAQGQTADRIETVEAEVVEELSLEDFIARWQKETDPERRKAILAEFEELVRKNLASHGETIDIDFTRHPEFLLAMDPELVNELYPKSMRRLLDLTLFTMEPPNCKAMAICQQQIRSKLQARRRAGRSAKTALFTAIRNEARKYPDRRIDASNIGTFDSREFVAARLIQGLHRPYRFGKYLQSLTPEQAAKWDRTLERLTTLKSWFTLCKPSIAFTVAITSAWGYAIMVPFTQIEMSTMGPLTIGTVLCAASASVINQLRETDTDAKMVRTMRRPLVTGAITLPQAKAFALGLGLTGTYILSAISPVAAALGALNIALYGGLYTTTKRITPLNTEVGAVVGAIPPMMGYFAALPNDLPLIDACLFDVMALYWPAMFMYMWQLQHVMLICRMRHIDYNLSGLKMQCFNDPRLSTTTSKGIAWALVGVPLLALPMATSFADLSHLAVIAVWAMYTYGYTKAIPYTNYSYSDKRNILIGGYLVLVGIVVLSLITRKGGRYDHVMFDDPEQRTRPNKVPVQRSEEATGESSELKKALDTVRKGVNWILSGVPGLGSLADEERNRALTFRELREIVAYPPPRASSTEAERTQATLAQLKDIYRRFHEQLYGTPKA